ncbi:MAG: hypothetical protein J4G14_10205, partial [Dehalococcoidia bacterium]|nr:hypothetical protein [Dehalococcoidia bacterium]
EPTDRSGIRPARMNVAQPARMVDAEHPDMGRKTYVKCSGAGDVQPMIGERGHGRWVYYPS